MKDLNIMRRSVLIFIACLILPGTALYFLLPKESAEDKETREMAERAGENPEFWLALSKFERSMKEQELDHQTWSSWEDRITKLESSKRRNVYGMVASARGTPNQERASQFLDKMVDDPDPEVRNSYCFLKMILGDPNWRKICESEAASGDSERRDMAEFTITQGDRLGR